MVEFGEQLRKAREEKGMTQQTLAEKLFVTRPTVSRWECGERFPDLLTTKKIAEILGVSLDNLLSGKDISVEVKRNPVVENKTAYNIIIALYAFVIFSCLIAIVSHISNYFLIYTKAVGFGGPVGAEAELIGYVSVAMMNFDTKQIMPMIKIVIQIVVFAFGLDKAIKGKLSPKMTGGIIVLYLALTSLINFAQVLATWIIEGILTGYAVAEMRYIIADFFIFLFPTISGAVLVYFLFIRGSNKKIFPTMIVFVSLLEVILNLSYTLYWIKYAIEETNSYYIEDRVVSNIDFGLRTGFTMNNMLMLLIDVAVYGLIVFQTVALWKKRKKLESVINSEGE